MADTLAVLVSEAKKGKYSLIRDLCNEDVLRVWDGLSKIVQSHMLLTKGVSLHGFGTFTFSQRKVDVSGNRFMLLQRPVLVMSESLLQTHSLSYPKQHATGQVPVVLLNYTVLSNSTGLDRDTVEVCICEIFRAFARSLASGRNVDLDFSSVGRLVIREKKARMKFFKEFIRTMDDSGALKSAFRPGSRPGSNGSIMSGPSRSSVRSATCGLLSLPKIIEVSEDVDEQLTLCYSPRPSSRKFETPNQNKIMPMASPTLKRPGTPFHTPKPVSALSFIKSVSMKETEDQSLDSTMSRPSTCSHSSTGHDLCYLCHQRAVNNVPISVTKERKERERIQEQLLQQFQHQKDQLEMAKEQSKLLRNKQIEQEVAQFNLESNEIRKLRERENLLKSLESYPSYLFQNRQLTPCYTMKQIEYCKQLDEQVKRRRTAMNKYKIEEENLEKKEQQELKKELEQVENEYTKVSAEKKVNYLQALNDQAQAKSDGKARNRSPSPINQPVFGVHDISLKRFITEKERAKSLYHEQVSEATGRKKGKKMAELRRKKEEADQLRINKDDLLKDVKLMQEEKVAARKELESCWFEAKQEKHHGNTTGSFEEYMLVQEQCKKYMRCGQCQRKRENKGMSNVLSESRYISGSRLMI